MFKSHSALETFRSHPGLAGADGGHALTLGEVPGTHLLQLGIYPGGAARVAEAVRPMVGELPDSPVQAAVSGDRLILRIAPDQYWVVGADSELNARLETALPLDAGCVTSLDGARTRLSIEGPAARATLSRLVAIDLHPAVFPLHGFAQTGIHHVGGLLIRVGEERYEFFALRTFAASVWEVLLDAAHSFGFKIALPES